MSGEAAPRVEILPDAEALATAVASRLVEHVRRLQDDQRVPSVVLTGGSVAERVHRAVLEVPGSRDVDWSRLEIWFGDERFVPADDPERNALQARDAFLSALPLDPARIHEMPASDGAYADDVDAAASGYAEELRRVLGPAPRFDVLMLGIGPDGHCASLFPDHDEVGATGLVVGVRNSPKPPPTRISMTMDLLHRADEVWFIAAGDSKAEAVRRAVDGADVRAVPAAGPKGIQGTLWLLDAAAASGLPPATA